MVAEMMFDMFEARATRYWILDFVKMTSLLCFQMNHSSSEMRFDEGWGKMLPA